MCSILLKIQNMRNILLIFVCIFTLLSCNAKTEKSSAEEVTINQNAVVTVDLPVEGMTCTGCENTVKKGVSEIPGVLDVSASFQEGRATVKFDTTLTNHGQISETIAKSGYKVTDHERTK
jgi:copper chaperone CopZ